MQNTSQPLLGAPLLTGRRQICICQKYFFGTVLRKPAQDSRDDWNAAHAFERKNQSPSSDKLADKLSAAGLRVTQARLALAHLLFGQGDRHVTADVLREEALAAGLKISQATVYNTLNQFHAAGLLRQVQVDQARSYFDTNIDAHHHFYVEEEARLIDIAAQEVDVARLPDSPKGYDVDRVEVIIRLDKSPKA